MENRPHIETLLTFFNEEDSKKSTPISNGHRLKFKFPSNKQDIIGMLTFNDVEFVYPSDIVKAQIMLFTDDTDLKKIYVGLDFDFYEGEQQIGTGIVSNLIK